MVNKGPFILIVASIALLILASNFTGNIISSSRQSKQSDISKISFEWGASYDSEDEMPFSYSNENSYFYGKGRVILQTTQNSIYYRVYDSSGKEFETTLNYPRYAQERGENSVNLYPIIFNDLDEEIVLEVCWSFSRDFNKYSDRIQCRKVKTQPPQIKILISPQPIRFYVDQDSYEIPRQNVTVKNLGKYTFNIWAMYIPNNYADPSYPKNYPSYPSYGFFNENQGHWGFQGARLSPGESAIFDVGCMIGSDTTEGTYKTTGYLASFSPTSRTSDAIWKQEFEIVTIVN